MSEAGQSKKFGAKEFMKDHYPYIRDNYKNNLVGLISDPEFRKIDSFEDKLEVMYHFAPEQTALCIGFFAVVLFPISAPKVCFSFLVKAMSEVVNSIVEKYDSLNEKGPRPAI